MIEVNLLPGGKKRPSRGGPKLSIPIPSIEGVPKDPWILGTAGFAVVALLAVAYLYFGVTGRHGELTVAVNEAVADSIRYADLIQQHDALEARGDSIDRKVAVIREIDEARYVWPHIMDEVARALPEYTWIEGLLQVSLGDELQFRVNGYAGNVFAMTSFMTNMEASPFIRGVELIESSQQAYTEGEVTRLVQAFTLEAYYQQPPEEMLETVPLFGDEPVTTVSEGT